MDEFKAKIKQLQDDQKILMESITTSYENMNLILQNQKENFKNEDIVITNQSRIIANQDIIVKNQLSIINNQNQIVQNQVTLGVILKFQVKILKQLKIIAGEEILDNDLENEVVTTYELTHKEFKKNQLDIHPFKN
jgi:predicted HNH restriction endonuclease